MRARPAVGVGLAALALVAAAYRVHPALADIVLHEYIVPDPAEDLRFGSTTSDGTMPAAIDTEAGPVASPDITREKPGQREGSVYGQGRNPPGTGGTYRVDRDTSRPDSVRYDDPFTPSIAPYKREYAYDAVSPTFELSVRDPSLVPVPASGTAGPADDQFYADVEVDLAGQEAVRIPTAGPGTRLLSFRVAPGAQLSYFRDSAESWFVRSDRTGRARLVLHLAVDRSAFGSAFARVEWPRLWSLVPPPAPAVRDEGVRVAREIGVVDGTDPAEALRILVAHFRSFAPSEDGPSSSGRELYRDLALSKKGVCRHRAYAFVVTALSLGLPSRFVRNEAHAWVEVSDAVRWHRIDLGGAAGRVDYDDDGRVAHVPPRDRYEWPEGSDSGEAMMGRSRAGGAGRPPGQAGQPGQAAPGTGAPGTGAPGSQPSGPSTGTGTSGALGPREPEAAPDPEDTRPPSRLTLKVALPEAKRGAKVPISGRVLAGGSPCPQVKVDLFLSPVDGSSLARIALGALVTDGDGRYAGGVTVPFGVSPGDYDVRARTPGGPTCGAGESE